MNLDFLVDFLIDYYGPIPYAAIFVILLICGFGVPIPEDITLIAGGILTYYGVCDVRIMILVSLLGVFIGDSAMFFLGHKYGRRLIKVWPFRKFITEENLEKVKLRLNKHGGKLLFAARFMPGVRSSIFFSTGMLHMPYKNLVIYDGGAALLSVPAIIGAVYYFGDFLESVVHWIKKVEGGILMLILLVIISFAIKYFWKKRRKGGALD